MNFSGPTPYALIFSLLLACGLGLPMPEDIILFAAGMMSYYKTTDVRLMIPICFCGVLFGDTAVFTLGSFFGRKIRRHPFVRRLLPSKRQRVVRHKLHAQGFKVIFAARFMPGLRAPIFFTAGTLHLPFRVFLFFDGLAATISIPTIVYLVYHFGYEVDQVIRIIKRVQFGIVGTIIGFVILAALKMIWSQRKEEELEEEEDAKKTS